MRYLSRARNLSSPLKKTLSFDLDRLACATVGRDHVTADADADADADARQRRQAGSGRRARSAARPLRDRGRRVHLLPSLREAHGRDPALRPRRPPPRRPTPPNLVGRISFHCLNVKNDSRLEGLIKMSDLVWIVGEKVGEGIGRRRKEAEHRLQKYLQEIWQEIMECNFSNVQILHCAEGSETAIETKIKTLDSPSYNLHVNKCINTCCVIQIR